MNKPEIVKTLEESSEKLNTVIINAEKSTIGQKDRLNFKIINGKPAFYRRMDSGNLVYVNPADEKNIRKLSTSYYARKIRSAAVKEKKQIDACLAILGKDPEVSDIDKAEERILDAGYVIGEDLIVTHEDSRHPLLPQEIDRIIEKYLT